jgi:hypothetical protein
MTLSTTAVIFKCLLDLNFSKKAYFAKNRDFGENYAPFA